MIQSILMLVPAILKGQPVLSDQPHQPGNWICHLYPDQPVHQLHLTWDMHNENYDRIYRVQLFMDQKDNVDTFIKCYCSL